MILTLLPLMASADDSGSCGTNVTYTYVESTHTLTISGNGAMDDYTWDNHPGWYSYRSEIVKIVIENGVTSIGNEAFNGCSLTSITIPNDVTSIGNRAFFGCSRLPSVIIPDSVTYIGSYAFCGCSGFSSVTIPKSVMSIGDHAFFNCGGLTSLTISNGVSSIGDYAFFGCSRLSSVTIPNSVTSIGSSAFQNCNELTSVVILGNVKSIGSGTFARCAKITDLYCHAEKVPSTRRDAFNNSYVEKATLHVPASALEAYKTTMPWSTFGTIVSIEDEAVAISTIADSNSPSGHVCNLQGQRLSSTRRGLFIRDGKKYVVK